MKIRISHLLIIISVLSFAGCNPNTDFDVMINAAVGDDIEVSGNEDEKISFNYKVDPKKDSIDLRLALANNPANGKLDCTFPEKTSANCIYTPNKNWHGTDAIYFKTSDGDMKGEKNGKVTIIINPVNDAPVVKDETLSMLGDSTLKFNLNATDADDPTVDLLFNINKNHIPSDSSDMKGTLVCDEQSNYRNCEYTAAKNEIGRVGFCFKAVDPHGASSESACIRIDISKQTYNANVAFTQPKGTILQGADILWVIDNSGSMASSQANLANNFSSFIDNFLVGGKARFKFKMAVTTSDSYLSSQSLMVKNSQGNLYDFSHTRAESDFANFKSDFQKAVNVGIAGSATEKTLASTHSVLASSDYANWSSGDDHALIIIVLSDEEEQSINRKNSGTGSRAQAVVDNLNPLVWVNYLKSFKSEGKRVKLFPIVKLNTDSNNYYQSIATAFGTPRSDITKPFDGILNEISNSVNNLVRSYSLDENHQIIESSLAVKVNGVAKTKGVDYAFLPQSNGINFINIPPEGSQITVTYQYNWK